MTVCRWAAVKTVRGQEAPPRRPSAGRCLAANQALPPDSFRRTHVSFPWQMESRRIYGKHNYSDIDSPAKVCRNRVPAGYNVPRLPLQCKRLTSSRGSLTLFPDWVDASRLQPTLDHPAASQSISLHDSISCRGAAGWWSYWISMHLGENMQAYS